MTSLTFSLIVILIAAPIWFIAVIAKNASSPSPADLWPLFLATAMGCGLTLSVAWGIRLIVLNL